MHFIWAVLDQSKRSVGAYPIKHEQSCVCGVENGFPWTPTHFPGLLHYHPYGIFSGYSTVVGYTYGSSGNLHYHGVYILRPCDSNTLCYLSPGARVKFRLCFLRDVCTWSPKDGCFTTPTAIKRDIGPRRAKYLGLYLGSQLPRSRPDSPGNSTALHYRMRSAGSEL